MDPWAPSGSKPYGHSIEHFPQGVCSTALVGGAMGEAARSADSVKRLALLGGCGLLRARGRLQAPVKVGVDSQGMGVVRTQRTGAVGDELIE